MSRKNPTRSKTPEPAALGGTPYELIPAITGGETSSSPAERSRPSTSLGFCELLNKFQRLSHHPEPPTKLAKIDEPSSKLSRSTTRRASSLRKKSTVDVEHRPKAWAQSLGPPGPSVSQTKRFLENNKEPEPRRTPLPPSSRMNIDPALRKVEAEWKREAMLLKGAQRACLLNAVCISITDPCDPQAMSEIRDRLRSTKPRSPALGPPAHTNPSIPSPSLPTSKATSSGQSKPTVKVSSPSKATPSASGTSRKSALQPSKTLPRPMMDRRRPPKKVIPAPEVPPARSTAPLKIQPKKASASASSSSTVAKPRSSTRSTAASPLRPRASAANSGTIPTPTSRAPHRDPATPRQRRISPEGELTPIEDRLRELRRIEGGAK